MIFVFLHDNIFPYILVCMITFQHQNQNVYQTQNVRTISHVYKKNARIHVLPIRVDKTLNAKSKTIEHYVFVFMVL